MMRIPTARLSLVIAALAVSSAWCADDFTFLHMSDVHFPHAASDSRKTAEALPDGPVTLSPYNVTVAKPDFAIITGDLDEFSGGKGWWEGYLDLWQGIGMPVYHQLGNHDNTWDCARPRVRKLHGSAFYAFEHGGVKFIGWDTSTPQDPRPSVATEGLLWLASEFEATPADQPIIFFCHHPLDGREFSGEYARSRLLELLQSRNVVAMLVGHGHGARAWKIAGIDTVMGGSAYGGTRGFGIVSVKDNVLRVCHQFVGDEPRQIALLEKPLAGASPFIGIASVSPQDGAVISEQEPLCWTLTPENMDACASARWTLDGDAEGDMVRAGATWQAELSREGMEPGAHTLRLEVTSASGLLSSRTVCFWLNAEPVAVEWKYQLSGSCQSTPLVAGGRLYVGANDGGMYCLDAGSGEFVWRFLTGGEVRSAPILDDETGLLYVASADGYLYALRADGTQAWKRDLGAPSYATPVVAGQRILLGTNAGDVLAISKQNGDVLWRAEEPEYCIETPVCVGDGIVFAGSWDRYFYAFDLESGKLIWKEPSKGSDRSGAPHYYSPADCGPAFVDGTVFVADRAYALTVFDAKTGKRLAEDAKCGAVSASLDGAAAYVRHSDGRITKRRADGTTIWAAEVPTGFVPAPPVVVEGKVMSISSLGTLSVIDEKTGAVLWAYKAFPDEFAFASPASDGERIYLADMAGHVLALSGPGVR